MAASERDEEARQRWRERMNQVDTRRLVFVDESAVHTALARLYAWAPRGQRAHAQVPRNPGKHTTLVAALTWQGLRAPWTLEGAVDTAAFEAYVCHVLAPLLEPGDIVVLDNLSAHTAERIRQAIAARGCEVLFLPAYSPDLSPIEQAFSKVKAILRRLAARSGEALLDALATAMAAVTAEDAHAWFAHAGYSSLAQAP